MPKYRNIVVVTLDSVRADHCSFMGYHRKTTPTLDKMARNGLIFENAVSPSHTTLPSMKAIFTGKFFSQNSITLKGVREQLLKEFKTQTTLAEIFRQKGYFTLGFSPNAWASSYFGFNKGFDHFVDTLSTAKVYGRIFKYLDKFKFLDTLRNLRNFILKSEVFAPWEKYYHLIIDLLKKVPDKPFFLWVFLIDTHIPYYCPKLYRRWSNFWDMNVLNIIYTWKIRKNNYFVNLSEKAHRVLINAYDDSIRYADLFIKRLWEDLEKYDPIFVIHADHGEGFNEHGFYGHYHPYLYEENIHVPFIIYNVEIKGKVKNPFSLLNLTQILPNIAENGNTSIWETFDDDSRIVISKAFGRDGKWRVAVRIKNWKYILGQRDVDELYNLKKDPHEQNNLINEYPDLAKEMRNIAKKHMKREVEMKKINEITSMLSKKLKTK